MVSVCEVLDNAVRSSSNIRHPAASQMPEPSSSILTATTQEPEEQRMPATATTAPTMIIQKLDNSPSALSTRLGSGGALRITSAGGVASAGSAAASSESSAVVSLDRLVGHLDANLVLVVGTRHHRQTDRLQCRSSMGGRSLTGSGATLHADWPARRCECRSAIAARVLQRLRAAQQSIHDFLLACPRLIAVPRRQRRCPGQRATSSRWHHRQTGLFGLGLRLR